MAASEATEQGVQLPLHLALDGGACIPDLVLEYAGDSRQHAWMLVVGLPLLPGPASRAGAPLAKSEPVGGTSYLFGGVAGRIRPEPVLRMHRH